MKHAEKIKVIKDLLVMQTIGECQIVTAAEFDAATASMGYPTTLNEALMEYGQY